MNILHKEAQQSSSNGMGQFPLMKHQPPSMFQHNQDTSCAFSCGDATTMKPITQTVSLSTSKVYVKISNVCENLRSHRISHILPYSTAICEAIFFVTVYLPQTPCMKLYKKGQEVLHVPNSRLCHIRYKY